MATTATMMVPTTTLPTGPRPSLSGDPRPSMSSLAPDHSQTRRVSSESQRTGSLRASSRRTPVPALLDSFPVPPSHIPLSPATPIALSPSSPLASSFPAIKEPPSAPLPPVPGPSPVVLSDLIVSRRSFQSERHVGPPSGLDTVPRCSLDGHAPPSAQVRLYEPGRPRKGSLSSLRNTAYSTVPSDQGHAAIQEEPAAEAHHTPPVQSNASASVIASPLSPFALDAALNPDGGIPQSIFPLHSSSASTPAVLRPSPSRKSSTGPAISLSDGAYVDDSIASIDMSDLNALKLDNEGDSEVADPQPFPAFPPVSQLPGFHPVVTGAGRPLYTHTPRKPSKASISSVHVFPTSSADVSSTHHRVGDDDDDDGDYGAHNDRKTRGGTPSQSRSSSPEIAHIISLTPRPRKRSTSARPRTRTSSLGRERKSSVRSRRGSDAVPLPPLPKLPPSRMRSTAELGRSGVGENLAGEETEGMVDEAHDSDSSLDLHTPLPDLMLRHGMLSPNSKLLPQPNFGIDPTTRMSIVSDVSHLSSASCLSNASNLSLASNVSTSSKHLKDARDTPKRRTRHRDGKLLKGGIGLTTGLGWSDSEDEDAPSALTRRLSRLVLSRRSSSSSIQSFRSIHSQPFSSHPLSRSISHSVLREVDEHEGAGPSTNPIGTSLCPVDEFGYTDGVASRSLPSRSGSRIVSRSGSTHSTGSGSGSRYSNYSTMSAPAASLRTRASSGSSSYEPMSRASSFSYRGYSGPGLALSIPEQDDGVTPTRAAFKRASLGAVGNGNGTQGSGESPHTPSSTASSASLSFPVTPDSTDIGQIDKKSEGQPVGIAAKSITNKDKSLPPLPPSGIPATVNESGTIPRGKYPFGLGLKAPSGLQRPRTYSNASSVSTHSVVGPGADSSGSVPTGGHNMSRSPSTTPGIPSATSRPSIGGASIPRPSLGIPRPSLSSLSSAVGSLPRPSLTLSSIKLPSSAPASTATSPLSPLPATGNGQGQIPRPLKLVPPRSVTSPSIDSPRSQTPFLSRTPTPSTLKSLEPGEQLPRPGQVLTYNRNLHDQLKLRALSPSSGIPSAKIGPVSPGGTQTLLMPQGSTSPSSSPLTSPTTGDSPKPKPRTGTGMTYRTNGTSRIRAPSTPVRP